jgi:hypothetical protein
MNYLETNDDYTHDVDFAKMNYQIRLTEPVEWFPDLVKENTSIERLNELLRSKIEMKNDSQILRTGNLFIEYKIDNKGDGILEISGLSRTEADEWFFNIGENKLFLTVNFLKWVYVNMERLEIETKANNNLLNRIGYGMIIPFYRLMELMIEFENIKETAATIKRVNEVMLKKKTL